MTLLATLTTAARVPVPDRGTVSMIEDRDTRPIGRRAVDEGRRATGCTGLFVPEPTLVAQVANAHSEGRLEDRLTHA
jgi:hypothetical protein